MLVLSRKQNQRIVFPNLGVTIEILKIAGNAVRVGVDAPPDVSVLRDEVAARQGLEATVEEGQRRRHELRNRLHTANLALHLLQKQLDAHQFDAADGTLQRAVREFQELDALLAFPAKSVSTEAALPRPKRRALLVEDNDNERELMAGILRLNGYEVEAVENGLAAMRSLEHGVRPDLVLLDMQMPRMDGGETVSAIRCNPDYEGLKVFAVSGADRRASQVKLGAGGVDRWFSKPLDPSQFLRELNRELECAAV